MKALMFIACAAAFLCGQALAQKAPVEIAPSPVVPAGAPDPLAPARVALTFSADNAKCRFAFTKKAESDPNATWATSTSPTLIRFDPRLPVGSRYAALPSYSANPDVMALYAKHDALGKPDDLSTLLPEGEFRITDVAPVKGKDDVFSFTPVPIAGRPDRDLTKIISQETGVLTIDHETWRVSAVALNVPPKGIKAGFAKLKAGVSTRTFRVFDDRYILAGRFVETKETSRRKLPTVVEVYGDFEPICDPTEVARIYAAEAAAQKKK